MGICPIDPQSRAIIRYALRRAEAGETIDDGTNSSATAANSQDDSSEDRIGPLAELICSGGEESAAALLVLMATLENSSDRKTLAHTAKHLAFTRCGELNAYGIVDAQVCSH